MVSAILVVIITIFIPPVGVAIVAGCGADLLINICLTLLGYFPGHIHAFYLEYTYYHRRDLARTTGVVDERPAPGIFSERVKTGGSRYGRVAGGGPGYVQQPAYGTVQAGGMETGRY